MKLTRRKAPADVKDWKFDFNAPVSVDHPNGPWLATSETITAHTVTADIGINLDSHSADTTSVTVWLSGGTAGQRYRVVTHITTSAGRQTDESLTISVDNAPDG